jgi:hypothetical protein
MLRRRLALVMILAAFAAAGCSVGEFGSPQLPLPPSPPDMVVVTKAAAGIFTALKLPGSPEISPPRPAHPSSLVDWMLCLRSDADDIPRNYALFVRNNTVVTHRLAVQIDGCARETFQPIGEAPR